ncbi:MAG: Ppx/GppA phosphatase family protein [Bilophila wadsworthia]
MSGELERTEKAIGIIDLGSNSVRLLLVRVHADGSTTILNQVKHMVRLGEGGFTHNRLQEETMARTIAVLRGLAEMCAVYETTEIIAIATAAVRDAVNGPEFIRRVQEKTGIDFTVVSGREEARLIYLGVSSGLEHSKSLRLFIDIGGGSTELIVGDSQSYVNLDSLKLGCVRLTNLFFEDNKGPVPPIPTRRCNVTSATRPCTPSSASRFRIPEAVASWAAQNLAEIAAALEQQDAARTGKPPRLPSMSSAMTDCAARSRNCVPGPLRSVNPFRASIPTGPT